MKDIFEDILSKEDKIPQKNMDNILKTLRKLNKPTISSQLHRIKRKQFHLDDRRIVYSGDVISRPLESFKAGKYIEMLHFGVVFGEDKNKQGLILEMNSNSNVSIVTLQTFLTKKYSLSDIEIEHRKPTETKLSDIIQRADILVNEKYSVTKLNCEQFVNFCLFGVKESLGLQNASKFASTLLDIATAYLDLQIAYTENESVRTVFKDFNTKTKKLNERIKKLK